MFGVGQHVAGGAQQIGGDHGEAATDPAAGSRGGQAVVQYRNRSPRYANACTLSRGLQRASCCSRNSFIPYNLGDWLATQLAVSQDAALEARAMVEPCLRADVAFRECHRNTAETGRVRWRPHVRRWGWKPRFRLWTAVPGVGPDWLP